MSERAAFINAILDNPEDDTARLVFADWLEENGEPERAAFIRLQIEAAELPEEDRRRSDPGEKAAWLHGTHGATWRAAVGIAQRSGRYERGFLTQLDFLSTQFPALAEQLLALEPAETTLHLVERHEDDSVVALDEIDHLATDSRLRAVTKIASQGGVGAERFVRLLKSPHLTNLREISLFEDPIGLEGVKAIAEAPAAFVLDSLDLNESLQGYGGEETDEIIEAIQVIATSPRFSSLRYLGLAFNELNDRSVAALVTSKTLPRTMRLDLEDNNHDQERWEEELAVRFTGGSDGEG